jgi:hypothetical protein
MFGQWTLDNLVLLSLATFSGFDLIRRLVTATLALVKRHAPELFQNGEI